MRCSVYVYTHIQGYLSSSSSSFPAVANGATSKVVEKFRDTGEGKWIATFFEDIKVFQVRVAKEEEGGRRRRKEARGRIREEEGRRKNNLM